MRIFFQSVLYLNVGLGALFFVIWLCTSVLMAEIAPSKQVVSSNPQPPSPPVPSSVGNVPSNVQGNVPSNVKSSEPVIVSKPQPPSPPVPSSVGNVQGNVPSNVKSSEPVIVSKPQPPSPPVPSSAANVGSTHSSDNSHLNTLTTNNNKGDVLTQIEGTVSNVIKLMKEYKYDSSVERNNPFVSTTPQKKNPASLTNEVPDYPTGKYNLNEITLVGIKWNSRVGPSTALFKTPDNNIHYLQLHDQIGKHRGIIYQLKEDEVVVLEPRFTGTTEEEYVPIIIHLDRWNTQRKEG